MNGGLKILETYQSVSENVRSVEGERASHCYKASESEII